jgi:hypothetical protein
MDYVIISAVEPNGEILVENTAYTEDHISAKERRRNLPEPTKVIQITYE